MSYIDERSVEEYQKDSGPYLARVVSAVDAKFMGALQVQLLQDVGTPERFRGSTITVNYLSPFYGVTDRRFAGKGASFNETQKSYGMWMIPPDPGTTVMVIFVNGNIGQGFWIGCVLDDYMNFMMPGLPATSYHNSKEIGPKKRVVGEFNAVDPNTIKQADATKILKPVHPFQSTLNAQGLADDEYRGVTTSSARREFPSAVFGISTPGPIDKKPNAPKGLIGKKDSETSAFVSRLGGSTFVMDDGDDKFLRKGSAGESPPEYANVELDEKGGNPEIPHNELVRIRTRTGHQILLHNSEDLIYIGNARGTTWIELTSNGKIDIYAEDSISIHTKNDLNITAARDINLKAGRNFNLDAGAKNNQTSKEDFNVSVGTAAKIETLDGGVDIKSAKDTKITSSDGTTYIYSSANHIEQAGREIHMNGPDAQQAASAPKASVPKRVPDREPWGGHENLNPKGHTPEMTNASDPNKSPKNGNLNSIPDTFRKGS